MNTDGNADQVLIAVGIATILVLGVEALAVAVVGAAARIRDAWQRSFRVQDDEELPLKLD